MSKKILCTLGPASLTANVIRRFDDLGVDLLRINMSHTALADLVDITEFIAEYTEIPVCYDTQGAQVRTGVVGNGQRNFVAGELIELTDQESETGDKLVLSPAGVLEQLVVGDLLSLDFDATLLQVIATEAVMARVVSGGVVGSNKAVTVIDREVSMPALTVVDCDAIQIGRSLGVTHFALSFASSGADVQRLRDLAGREARIIAKIESLRGLENLAEILDATDMVLIDRGDLSREVPLEKLPYVQKQIIRASNRAGIPVFVATNLLESMVSRRGPTRAEVNDVINTLLDGADGLVLAAETAVGEHPVGCVSMIRSLINEHDRVGDGEVTFGDADSHSPLPDAHGGVLVQQIAADRERDAINELPRIDVDEETSIDAGEIALGSFSPLRGFMGRETLEAVLANHRLPSGDVWPMPILFPVPKDVMDRYSVGDVVALSTGGDIRAIVEVREAFEYDLHKLAKRWFGVADERHPGAARVLGSSGCFLAGSVSIPRRVAEARKPYQLSPKQARLIFEHRSWLRVVGFHTRNVAHRAHEYLMREAVDRHACDGLFIHPVIGPKKAGDFSPEIILKTYQYLVENSLPTARAVLGAFAGYSRYAGPREAVFTALCRKNFGCSHFIIGRDHTGVREFYDPSDSYRIFDSVGDLGIQLIFFDEIYYCSECKEHVEVCPHGTQFSEQLAGTTARALLADGEALPDWFVRGEISEIIIQDLSRGEPVFIP